MKKGGDFLLHDGRLQQESAFRKIRAEGTFKGEVVGQVFQGKNSVAIFPDAEKAQSGHIPQQFLGRGRRDRSCRGQQDLLERGEGRGREARPDRGRVQSCEECRTVLFLPDLPAGAVGLTFRQWGEKVRGRGEVEGGRRAEAVRDGPGSFQGTFRVLSPDGQRRVCGQAPAGAHPLRGFSDVMIPGP